MEKKGYFNYNEGLKWQKKPKVIQLLCESTLIEDKK